MKKIFGITALFCTTLFQLKPITYTNKTYMAIPTPHYHLPMKYTSWHRILKQGSSSENPWGGTLLATPFYRATSNNGKLGKYFGTNYKSTLKIDIPRETTDIQNDLIMHRYDDYPSLQGTLKIDPKHTSYGIYLSYNQELENLHKGLFFRVNLPIEHVENDLRATAIQTKYLGKSILDYFSGGYSNDDANNLQAALTHAKICGIQGSTGVADIELLLGWKLAEKKEHEVEGSIKVIVPTGSSPNGEYMFESLVGNGSHWGIGFNCNTSMNIMKSETSSMEFIASLDYTYLLKGDEKRTLGFRNLVLLCLGRRSWENGSLPTRQRLDTRCFRHTRKQGPRTCLIRLPSKQYNNRFWILILWSRR